MRLVVDVDKNSIKAIEDRLGAMHKQAPNAISRALNRAATNVNSNIKKEVRKEYNISSGDITKTLKKTNASKSNLKAEVRSTGALVPLDKFKISPKTVNPNRKSQIKIAVKKDGLKTVIGAFVADVNGKKVFKRQTKQRLPINRLFGPSIPQMLGNEDVKIEIEKQGQEMFQIRLEHEINRILQKGTD